MKQRNIETSKRRNGPGAAVVAGWALLVCHGVAWGQDGGGAASGDALFETLMVIVASLLYPFVWRPFRLWLASVRERGPALDEAQLVKRVLERMPPPPDLNQLAQQIGANVTQNVIARVMATAEATKPRSHEAAKGPAPNRSPAGHAAVNVETPQGQNVETSA